MSKPSSTKPTQSLANLERSISKIDQVSAMQATLRQAAYDAISGDQVTKIVQKQVEKALAGDEKAASFVMRFAVGLGGSTKINQTNVLCTDVGTAAKLSQARNR
jgi:hypothetical protein